MNELYLDHKIISKNNVPQESGESATDYLFIEFPYVDGKPLPESVIQEFLVEEYQVRIYSDYDCTGRWFTSGIDAKIFDNDDWDEKTIVACRIGWGLDV